MGSEIELPEHVHHHHHQRLGGVEAQGRVEALMKEGAEEPHESLVKGKAFVIAFKCLILCSTL